MGESLEQRIESTLLKHCEEGLGFKIEDRRKYMGFVRRQLKRKPKGRMYYLGRQEHMALLADMVLMLGYLTGDIQAAQKQNDADKTFINSEEKLKLLRVAGRSGSLWNDASMYQIYWRRLYAFRKHRNGKGNVFMSYSEMIDEVGRDRVVVKKWGRRITYLKDITFKRDARREKVGSVTQIYKDRGDRRADNNKRSMPRFNGI